MFYLAPGLREPAPPAFHTYVLHVAPVIYIYTVTLYYTILYNIILSNIVLSHVILYYERIVVYYLLVSITCLQGFAKAAKLAIISIKPALRIRATSPNRRPACQMRLAKGGKTRKPNE